MEKKYLTVKDACEYYSLRRTKMRQFAEEVGAVRKVGRRVLINTDIVNRAIEDSRARQIK